MDQMQVPHTIPHLVQVNQQSITTKIQNPQIIHISNPHLTPHGKVTYQQTITSESIHIPLPQEIITEHIDIAHQQQISNMLLQHQLPTQVIQGSDVGQPLHVILPQVPIFKQHMIVNGVQPQYYGQYEIAKEPCIVVKIESEGRLSNDKQVECKIQDEKASQSESVQSKKRTRNPKPNPSMWACNVRKLKHQRGESYVSRRGKFVPERKIKTTKDCLRTCKYKCSERINNSDREHIFKAFYSLNANEKKHFLLNTTERHCVKHNKFSESTHKRQFSFRYFFLVRSVKYTVCKNFYLGTLAISQKPVYNVHLGKSDMNIPKPDGRGMSEASSHSLPLEVKDRVRKHIMSYKTADLKPVKQFSKKKQYLELNLNIKDMYTAYYNDSCDKNVTPVKESMYRKIFKQEFNLHFRKAKDQLCLKCKGSLK